jgi:hypothetical protein
MRIPRFPNVLDFMIGRAESVGAQLQINRPWKNDRKRKEPCGSFELSQGDWLIRPRGDADVRVQEDRCER